MAENMSYIKQMGQNFSYSTLASRGLFLALHIYVLNLNHKLLHMILRTTTLYDYFILLITYTI